MITLWQAASLPFWLASAYFIALAVVELFSKGKPKCVPCNLIAAGCFAYVAARLAT